MDVWTCFVLWMRGSRFTSLLWFQLFCGCGFPLHCFSVYLEFGITESLESNAALVVMNQFCGSVVFTLAWRCVPHSVTFLFLQCFARTAKKFSAKSFGRLLNGLHVSQLWETLTDASVAM